MNKDLTEKLFTKFPKIFRDKTVPMNQSLVCFGFEFGDGWNELMDQVCQKLQTIADLGGPQWIALQMKEKYAGLRFYGHWSENTDTVRTMLTEEQKNILAALGEDAVERAQHKSYQTCEECGEYVSETFHMNGWDYALCTKHAANLILGRMLGQWPTEAGDTQFEQKLMILKEKGFMFTGDVDKFAGKHLTDEGREQMTYLSSFLTNPTYHEIELAWMWFISSECFYDNHEVLKLLGVPDEWREELDYVQTRCNSRCLYAAHDSEAVGHVVIAIMKWEVARLEKHYNEERAKKHDDEGSNEGIGSSSPSAGSGPGEVDPDAQQTGCGHSTGEHAAGSGTSCQDSGGDKAVPGSEQADNTPGGSDQTPDAGSGKEGN